MHKNLRTSDISFSYRKNKNKIFQTKVTADDHTKIPCWSWHQIKNRQKN